MATRHPSSAAKPLRGHHVLFWLGGFFGLMFLANGIFVYFAVRTFPGEDVRKSYLTGLDYNRTLEARAAQSASGWQATAALETDGVLGSVPARLVVRLTRADGSALETLAVQAELRRTTTDVEDIHVTLQPVGERGYISNELPLCEGLWELRLMASGPDGERFEARREIVHGRDRVSADDPEPGRRCPVASAAPPAE
jgi:nitrogen fixation protein FixH